MAAKPEATKPEAAAAAAAAAASAAEPAAPAAGGKSFMAFLPLVAVVVLAPVLSLAVGQFFLLPQLKKQLAAPADSHAAAAAESPAAAPAEGGHAKGGKEGAAGKRGDASAPTNYEFENIVVNLSGTMGTRYLKTTFLVTGTDNTLHGTFEHERAKLVDVTLNVLSSLTLADVDEAGAKNLIRERLVAAFNEALKKRICEQVYFSDFVVQ
jgi:flagellar FliL protein